MTQRKRLIAKFLTVIEQVSKIEQKTYLLL